ncbi:hypothetical protein MRX96_001991 [Rhipicephalus microplus]
MGPAVIRPSDTGTGRRLILRQLLAGYGHLVHDVPARMKLHCSTLTRRTYLRPQMPSGTPTARGSLVTGPVGVIWFTMTDDGDRRTRSADADILSALSPPRTLLTRPLRFSVQFVFLLSIS